MHETTRETKTNSGTISITSLLFIEHRSAGMSENWMLVVYWHCMHGISSTQCPKTAVSTIAHVESGSGDQNSTPNAVKDITRLRSHNQCTSG